jgi:hypothetical protein
LHDKQQKDLVDQALTLSGGSLPRGFAPRPLADGEEH